MTFKTYLQLLIHVLIAAAILLSAPMLLCVLLYDVVTDLACAIISVSSCLLLTMYPTIKYISKVADKF